MVMNSNQDTRTEPAKQGVRDVVPEPGKTGARTPYDFEGRNLAACGGLLPIATMLEKLSFRQPVEETLTVQRRAKAMSLYQFVLAMVLACQVGFSRLCRLRLLEREPMLTGTLQLLRLPPQCTFRRFLASLQLGVARQVLHAAVDARAGLGSGQRATERSGPGHRHHRAHAVRQPDGRTHELQAHTRQAPSIRA